MASKSSVNSAGTRWDIPATDAKHGPQGKLVRRVISYLVGLGLVLTVLTVVHLFELFPQDQTTTKLLLTGISLSVGFTLLIGLFRVIRKEVTASPHKSDTGPSRTEQKETNLFSKPLATPAEIQSVGQRTRALEILYDISAAINISQDLDDLLERFLQTLQNVWNAQAVTVRLTSDSGGMRLLAGQSLHREVLQCEELLAVQDNFWEKTLDEGNILVEPNLQACSEILKAPSCNGLSLCMIGVPVRYFGKILGVYTLFLDRDSVAVRKESRQLLINIGRHLGIAIEKARADEETNRISIMEERNHLAEELHDSLAQSLASLRFQVRVLDETLHQGDESALWRELEKIENSLDEAYKELRGMITHFRAPMGAQGLSQALVKLINRFRNETPMHIFLQNDWGRISLPEEVEMQVLRIIQESLANIRKHSQARHVRVLLGGGADNNYRILVEDDGIGMVEPSEGSPGEHIGLSIMEERAKRLGGELRVESEAGEGTRVVLRFRYPAEESTISKVVDAD
ncbi:MAG: ATP-binding protein [Gammaproteobacteria bacterium]